MQGKDKPDYGKAVDLLLTDYRSGRPDHLIPEDAFPGALIADACHPGRAQITHLQDLVGRGRV